MPRAAERAIAAGADMVLVSNPRLIEDVYGRLPDAVDTGRVSQRRSDSAARRVLRVKGYGPAAPGCLILA